MSRNKTAELSNFFVAGINYKKTDTSIRGSYAIGPDQYQQILQLAPAYGIQDLFVLSTCNRTEIYGIAENADELVALLCSQTEGTTENFEKLAYHKNGMKAIRHLFDVGAGLDSQILGDYEIVGQIRQSVKKAREHKFIFSFLDKTVNQLLECSKLIKNKTSLSDGTVSVAFAAVHYMRAMVPGIENKNIVLLGTGKIGRSACKNMVDYLHTHNITLVNRTEEKARSLATELGLKYASMLSLQSILQEADIVLVATNAPEVVISVADLRDGRSRLIIDLSIPCNVDKEAASLPNIRLIDVDELSKMKDETLKLRALEVPKAKAIIAEQIQALLSWHEMRKNVPVLKEVKSKLLEIHTSPLFEQPVSSTPVPSFDSDERIQRVLNGMASKMRRENQRGCYYIQAINEFIAAG